MDPAETVEMHCRQCSQTAGGRGCTRVGVCGKQPTVALLHRRLKERFDPHGIFNPGRLIADL